MPRLPLIIAASMLLAGCTSASRTALVAEVDRMVHPGLDSGTAAGRLASIGFRCGKSYDARMPDDLLCTRDRSYYIAATCLQRVYLGRDAKGVVRSIAVMTPACAGL